eukprot:TRINITY_DN3319_c0_g1_i1.p2 TRINITY_DN3319_c0_g1~~TRINITY_DN3319_c0_g1_i1.p2  ORF type:complete len:186 (+),score=29.02 TRINITY_DN3319_c0_g1_i1:725-1282(+)
MTCEKCKHTYCYAHSDAHPDLSCREYERKVREQERESKRLIASTTRGCPGCGFRIDRTSGCAHMTCSRCHASFCWLCGRSVASDTFPTHYAWWNICGCPNAQMQDEWNGGFFVMMLYRLLYLVGGCLLISLGISIFCIILALLLAYYVPLAPLWIILWMLDYREPVTAPLECCGGIMFVLVGDDD